MDLLSMEIAAKMGRNPDELYRDLEEKLGKSFYKRIDIAASPEEKTALEKLSPDMVTENELAGEKIVAKLTNAPGNGAPSAASK